MDRDDYALVKKKPLKLTSPGGKEKSKKGKHKIKQREAIVEGVSTRDTKIIVSNATKAEEAFKAKQGKIAQERILKKASKTHKQRVEEFNKHLDSLSEHYDIPKVSWTK